jgi:diadenosine tetraphosphate (Ap4A) HIT family hydrolase
MRLQMIFDIECEFCDEFLGGSRNSFAARYSHDLRDRTVIETDHVKVMPSLGHFVKGYLLLVPKPHYCTLADAPREVIRQVEGIKRKLITRLSPLYGPYVFFEHGSRTSLSGGCGIYHAHLHALPVEADEVLSKLREQFDHMPIASLFELRAASSQKSCLYCEDSKALSWLFFPAFLPSQFMRRLIADAAGISQWDWRQSGRENALLATRSEVLTALSIANDSR